MVIKKGIFVTFEGPNGVGKSSILNGVVTKLKNSGIKIVRTREPTNSILGDFILQAEEEYKGKTLAFLVAADRNFHLENEVLPALNEGKIILSDRYIESSLVLQKIDGLDTKFIWILNNQFYIPDLSIILTASVDALKYRLNQREKLSRFERNNSSERELKLYLEAGEFLSKHGFNILIIDNEKNSIEDNVIIVYKKIIELVKNRDT